MILRNILLDKRRSLYYIHYVRGLIRIHQNLKSPDRIHFWATGYFTNCTEIVYGHKFRISFQGFVKLIGASTLCHDEL